MCGGIPYQADIGRGIHFSYRGLGVVIHKKAVIGETVLFSRVLHLVAMDKSTEFLLLVIMCFIGAGAVLIERIHVGNNVRIGPNTFVNTHLLNNYTVVGHLR